jgi:hypothetical protein
MTKFRKRHPRTKAELRDKAAGENRSSRGYIPTERDDMYTKLQRSWKKKRKTKYRVKDIDHS